MLVAACGGDSDPSTRTDAGADASNDDASDDAGTSGLEQGLLLATPDRRGPIEWIPVDDAGIHPRVTLVDGID
ncbi:MAG TPA: hypothetical protein VIV40_04355, partial [Kofleriaceae bacterium]